MTTTHWIDHAACAGRPELPWTSDATDLPAVLVEMMAGICQRCPVVLDCLAAVDALDVTGGFWAGKDRDPHATASTAPASTGVVWVPIRSRAGAALAEQAAFDFTRLGGAA